MKLGRRQFLRNASRSMTGLWAMQRIPALHALAADPLSPLAHDPRRPQFHLLPAANWMNDPNGPVFYGGQHHMFYQYNPGGAIWGDMHWGHAVSPDMVHWRNLAVALAPTPGGPDAGGCFTGTAIADGDRIAMLYTGVVPVPEADATIRNGANSLKESQCLAVSANRDLTVWTKDPLPVIAAPPAGLDVTGFRDPVPWRQGDLWYMAVGSGLRGKSGAVLLYRSHDLRHWEYLHLLAEGSPDGGTATDPVVAGHMWECPDFFPLGTKHVLLHSHGGHSFWQTGAFDTDALVFRPERGGFLDYGSFYAAKTQLDQAGHRILWGWITESRPEAEYRAAGWAGMMSLPRVLTLDDRGDLRFESAKQVGTLRKREQKAHLTGIKETDRQRIAALRLENGCGEIACSFRAAFDISLIADSGVTLLTCHFDPAHPGVVQIDDQAIPAGSDAEIHLRFLIDGSVIECFVNTAGAYTKRFYPPGLTAPAIGVAVRDGSAASVSVWQYSPISSNRLTS
ncbi:MAG TPA: glycoside hydrolase family 32 protein [Acidobacteriaceae bacterium]|jgi:beta-fructofuranosidase|nr:glycoside hydrolase family 32 protein [Acidobacteriaceae bacterium]